MPRFMTFLLGMAAGAGLLWGALHYHVLNSKKGFRLIPKTQATLAKTYVDVRPFTVADWANNADLVLAITRAGQQDLIENAAHDALQNGIDRLLGPAPL